MRTMEKISRRSLSCPTHWARLLRRWGSSRKPETLLASTEPSICTLLRVIRNSLAGCRDTAGTWWLGTSAGAREVQFFGAAARLCGVKKRLDSVALDDPQTRRLCDLVAAKASLTRRTSIRGSAVLGRGSATVPRKAAQPCRDHPPSQLEPQLGRLP